MSPGQPRRRRQRPARRLAPWYQLRTRCQKLAAVRVRLVTIQMRRQTASGSVPATQSRICAASLRAARPRHTAPCPRPTAEPGDPVRLSGRPRCQARHPQRQVCSVSGALGYKRQIPYRRQTTYRRQIPYRRRTTYRRQTTYRRRAVDRWGGLKPMLPRGSPLRSLQPRSLALPSRETLHPQACSLSPQTCLRLCLPRLKGRRGPCYLRSQFLPRRPMRARWRHPPVQPPQPKLESPPATAPALLPPQGATAKPRRQQSARAP